MEKKKGWKSGLIALPVILIAVSAGFLFWMMTGAMGYRQADWTDTDGQVYYQNTLTRRAFAAGRAWDGADGAVIEIPDRVHGCRVTALGGYSGRGVPSAFGLNAPETWDVRVGFGDAAVAADAEKDYPNAQIIDCSMTLKLGKNIEELNELRCCGFQGYDEAGRETVWRFRWYVECSEENETFYAENGRLYYRADGALAADFIYWDE